MSVVVIDMSAASSPIRVKVIREREWPDVA